MWRKLALTQTTYGVLTGAGCIVHDAAKSDNQGAEITITQEGAKTVLRLNPPPFAGVGTLARVVGASTEMPKFSGEIV